MTQSLGVNYQLISTAQEAAALISRIPEGASVAIDTEFVRVRTFFPLPGLVQLQLDNQQFLILPECLTDGLATALLSQPKEWVVHAGFEDVEVFHDLAPELSPVFFDTQIAGGLLGMKPAMSLQALVEQEMQVHIEKNHARTDWLKRPLQLDELAYAAEDVVYLGQIAERFKTRLAEHGRLEWLYEDCRCLLTYQPPVPEQRYLSFGDAWRLNDRELALFAQLTRWRDETAIENNLARNFVISDRQLFSVVQQGIRHRKGLFDLGIHPKSVRQFGQGLLEQLEAVQYDSQPVIRPDRPLSKAEQKLLSTVKKQVVRSANELSVDPQVVMSKRYSVALYRAVIKAQAENGAVLEELLPEYLLGWRFDQVVKPCVSIIKQELESL